MPAPFASSGPSVRRAPSRKRDRRTAPQPLIRRSVSVTSKSPTSKATPVGVSPDRRNALDTVRAASIGSSSPKPRAESSRWAHRLRQSGGHRGRHGLDPSSWANTRRSAVALVAEPPVGSIADHRRHGQVTLLLQLSLEITESLDIAHGFTTKMSCQQLDVHVVQR